MALFCLQPDQTFEVAEEITLFEDEQIISKLLKREKEFLPNVLYFHYLQTDIKEYMRLELSKWMMGVISIIK